MIKNIFEPTVTQEIIERVNKLNADSKQKWGKMNTGQMLAHLNVTYEMIYDENKLPKPKGFKAWMLKKFVKPIVVGEKTYKKNSRTAPQFIKENSHNFDQEKTRLIDYLNKTQALGGANFEGKTSHSFGKLTQQEWNNMFYKHLDHHLRQFGV